MPPDAPEPKRRLRILGIRGVPAVHGGFETFTEYLSLYLVERGWDVIVYCQEDGRGPMFEDEWQGVRRVRIPIETPGPLGTIYFDWKATLHAARQRDLCLTLGYNTALFCAWLRLKGIPNLINMDGIEWSRAKWGTAAKAWFWLNERGGSVLADHLVADHPKIREHLLNGLTRNKLTMIPYGAERIVSADTLALATHGLAPGGYMTVVARPEPENSILEIVSGFSRRPRGITLAVLGRYEDGNAYHRAVREAASAEVRFLGAIYDKPAVQALRFHGMAYVHGHQVGGTNPSLVEALGAGNAVIAHDNRFNRWVVGPSGRFFQSAEDFDAILGELLAAPPTLEAMRIGSVTRFEETFTLPTILGQYEALLSRFLPRQLQAEHRP